MFLIIAAAILLLAVVAALILRKRKAEPSEGVWEIGPIISGRNYSINLPRYLESSLDFGPDAEPHYVTRHHGPLTGKKQIRMRCRIEAKAATIYPAKFPDMPAQLTLYFQRKGDDWRTDGWRWWATFATITGLADGEYEIVAPLDANWTSVMELTAATHPEAFRAALADADRVGFTFGGGDGFGHGVRATGPVRFVLTGFDIL